MQGNHSIRRGVVGGAVAAASVLTASCSAPASPEVERTEWSVTDPVLLPPTTESVDQCAMLSQQDPLLDFSTNRFAIDDDKPYDYQVKELIDLAVPGAMPPEFAAQVVTSLAPNTAQPNVTINVDVSKGFEHWVTPVDENTPSQITRDKSIITETVGDLTYIMNDYPTGFFDVLGIKSIDLSDEYPEGDDTAGYYLPGEIHIEAEMYERGLEEEGLRFVLSHELGHAIHEHWCNGADSQDDELAGDIKFYGTERMRDADGNKLPIAPKETLAYGPERVYPGNEKNDYTASSIKEYFAGIVAFTIEERGLILPGDADYGSVLQKNQELVVNRAEKLFPGFRAFAEQRTKVLRLSEDNEIYQDAEKIEVKISDLRAMVEASDQDLVVNGVLLDEASFLESYTDAVVPFPGISQNYSKPDQLELKKASEKTSMQTATVLSGEITADYDNVEAIVYVIPDNPELFIPQDSAPAVDQYGMLPKTQKSINTPETVAMVDDLVARGAKPVRVVFVKD